MNQFIPEYIDALCQEVNKVLSTSHEKYSAQSIYFGGGTPSLVPTEALQSVIHTLQQNMDFNPNIEISIEVNPGTVKQAYLRNLRQVGFNRISIGMQSASQDDLNVLDRKHQLEDVDNTVNWSRDSGFENLNLDLIFGIPGQTLESWKKSLQKAISLKADHYSLYSLSIEDGTPLHQWIKEGKLTELDDETVGSMYEEAMDMMQSAGFQQYEISNWARSEDTQCRHNLQYWHYKPWFGFGAGAHGFVQNIRTENTPGIQDYINRVHSDRRNDFPSGPALIHLTKLSTWELIQENLMMSLRLTREGIGLEEFQKRYQVNLQDLFEKQISLLLRTGLLEFTEKGKRFRLTHKGRLLGNQVFSRFIGQKLPLGFEHLDR
jgi:oxygen-independent coproporphyrinogen-3 oxidase